VDFAVTCPLQKRYNNSDNPANMYAKFCAAVVDTFGQWSDEGLDLISDVVKRAAKRLITEPNQFRNVAWQQLSCTLQTHNSRMTISRLPSPTTDIT